MLILSHTDGFRVDFHQLCQWICQTAGDGHRTTHGDIVVGKLSTSHCRSGIDRSSVFAHQENGDFVPIHLSIRLRFQTAHQFFGFTSCRTITNRHGFYAILLRQFLQGGCGSSTVFLGFVRINRGIVQEIALFIKAHHLTSCAKTRVDAHDSARTERRSEEQLLQILCKHADGFFVCLLFTLRSKLCFDAGAQQSLVGIGGSSGDLRSRCCVGAHKGSGDAVGCPTLVGRSDGHA